jgi:hypothetical protein
MLLWDTIGKYAVRGYPHKLGLLLHGSSGMHTYTLHNIYIIELVYVCDADRVVRCCSS